MPFLPPNQHCQSTEGKKYGRKKANRKIKQASKRAKSVPKSTKKIRAHYSPGAHIVQAYEAMQGIKQTSESE